MIIGSDNFLIFLPPIDSFLVFAYIRAGSRRERRRRTIAKEVVKNEPFSDPGIPSGGGKPKKASTNAIIAGPPLGSQIVSRQISNLHSAICKINQHGYVCLGAASY
jgi:hypothetical protein